MHLARDSQAHFWVKISPGGVVTSCCFALLCGGGTGKLAWPIMPEQCRLSTAAHCAQIFALFRPPPSIPPSHPFRHSHPRPAGTEMAAPLTRFTIPPLVHATIAGHGHRHLYGTQERLRRGCWGLTGRWCCQRLGDALVAFSADKGLAERVSSF